MEIQEENILRKYREFFMDTSQQNYILNKTIYDDLRCLMQESFRSQIFSIALLFGGTNSGFRETITKILEENIDLTIFLDAQIYDQDISLLKKLLQELDENIEIEKEDNMKNLLKLKSKLFAKGFEEKKIVIVIENVDILVQKKRQTFFYTILDDFKQLKDNPFLIFQTSNLFLLNKLERRVRSRFTFTPFFFGLVDQKLINFFQQIKIDFKNGNEKKMKQIFLHQKILNKLELIFYIEADYLLIKKLLAGSFAILKPSEFKQMIRKPLEKAVSIYSKALDQSIKLFSRLDKTKVVRSLPDIDKILLNTIYHLLREQDMNQITTISNLLEYRSLQETKKKLSCENIFKSLN